MRNSWIGLKATIDITKIVYDSRERENCLIKHKNDRLKELYAFLDNEMKIYKFSECSSVNPDFEAIASNVEDLYKTNQAINLEIHTKGVVSNMQKLLNENGLKSDVLIAIAYLHDFAKSEHLVKHYGLNSKNRHHVNSAIYSKSILYRNGMFSDVFTEEENKIIFDTIKSHHEEDRNINNFYMRMLIEADIRQRNFEKKLLIPELTKNNEVVEH